VPAQPGFELLWLDDRGGQWVVCWTDPVVAWAVRDWFCVPVVPGDRLAVEDDEKANWLLKYPNGKVQSSSFEYGESVEEYLAELNATRLKVVQ
jgi:hypothetical protein